MHTGNDLQELRGLPGAPAGVLQLPPRRQQQLLPRLPPGSFSRDCFGIDPFHNTGLKPIRPHKVGRVLLDFLTSHL